MPVFREGGVEGRGGGREGSLHGVCVLGVQLESELRKWVAGKHSEDSLNVWCRP